MDPKTYPFSHLHNHRKQKNDNEKDEDGDYPFIYTVTTGIPKAALNWGAKIIKDKEIGKFRLSYILTLNSSCPEHLTKTFAAGRVDDLYHECEDFLAYTTSPYFAAEQPKTLFHTINETFQIPKRQQWWLWGVTKEVPTQEDTVKLNNCADIIKYIAAFYTHIRKYPEDKSRWVMYLVLQLSTEQPKLLPRLETTEPKLIQVVEHREPKILSVTEKREPKLPLAVDKNLVKNEVHHGRHKEPADAVQSKRREERHKNSERRKVELPDLKYIQRKREDRQQKRETPVTPVRQAPQKKHGKHDGSCKEKESFWDLPPKKGTSTRKAKTVPPRAPSPPPPPPSPPLEPLIPQDTLNDDRLCRPNTLLRQMNTSFKPDSVMNLLPLSGPPTDRQWAEYCELLGLNPEQHRDPTARSIHIPGTKLWATPQQYRTAFRMLKRQTHHKMAGGYLADEPGTGKTYTVLVYVLLRTLIFHSKYEVETSRPRNHQVYGNMCSCKNAVGVQCYAITNGITRNIIKGGLVCGPALLQTEATVIESWKTALCEAKLSNTYYHAVLLATTKSGTPRELAQPDNLVNIMGCRARADASTIRYYKEQKEKEIPVDNCSFSINERRGSEQPLERYIFLTTYTGVQLKRLFQIPVICQDSTRNSRKTDMTVYCCPVGVHIVDEYHKQSSIQSSSMKLAYTHKKLYAKLYPEDYDNSFSFWAVSGTPFPSDRMTDISGFLELLQRPDWSVLGHPHHVRRLNVLPELENLRIKAATGGPVERSEFKQRLDEFWGESESSLLIRHVNANTTQPMLVSFATVTYHCSMQMLSCAACNILDQQVKAGQVKTHQEAATSIEGFNALRLLRMLSSFPALAPLLTDDGFEAVSLLRRCQNPAFINETVLMDMENRDAIELSPVAEVWRMVTKNSPKLDFVLRLLRVMDHDKTMRVPEPEPESGSHGSSSSQSRYLPDVDLAIKKLVVVTPDILESVLYYVALRDRRPDCRPLLLHGRMSSKARMTLLDEWNSLKMTSSRILVTTFDVGGTGINLQVANYQVLTSPLRHASQEEQCFKRTNRTGQRLPLHHYLLLSEDNPYDRLMMANHAGIDLPGVFSIGGSWGKTDRL